MPSCLRWYTSPLCCLLFCLFGTNCFGLLVVGAIKSEPLGGCCWGFPDFLTWVNTTFLTLPCTQAQTRTRTHARARTQSEVAITKGQKSTAFKPWRCSYCSVAAWSLYDTLRVRGSWLAGIGKKPLGIAEKSREKVRRRERESAAL